MQRRNCRPSGMHLKFSATPRHQPLVVELQVDTSTRDFQSSGALIISDEQVHQPQRHGIERASHGYSEFAEPESAAILHRCLEAGGESDHVKDLSNSSRVMAR